jgi:hypothetical protein
MPHRSTVWRRKARVDASQPVNVSLGRTTKEHAERSRRRAADLVARCACEWRTKGDRIDVGDIVHFKPTKLSRLVCDILVKRDYSAGLLQVAASDVLLLGGIGRRLSPRVKWRQDDELVARLMRDHGLGKSEAKRYARKRPPWLKVLLVDDDTTHHGDNVGRSITVHSRSRACPSRSFEINSRMVAYWRAKEDYGVLCDTLGYVAYGNPEANGLVTLWRKELRQAKSNQPAR